MNIASYSGKVKIQFYGNWNRDKPSLACISAGIDTKALSYVRRLSFPFVGA